MTWKSTAVAGVATITATWLASYAPVGRPAPSVSNAPSIARTETAAAEIQREADRLHARLVGVGAYQEPARNPFRFRARVRSAPVPRAPRREPALTVEDLPVDPTPQPTFRMTLSGIAEDIVGEETIRTAIISTPDDVFLVKVGEQVGDRYKVAKIGSDMVELVTLDDITVVRLTLRR